jgi:hypothetical protein
MKRLAVAVLCAFVLSGCSSDRNIRITDANKDTILKQIQNSKSFTVEEIGLLTARQVRIGAAAAFNQPAPKWVGLTLQEVIDDERKIQADETAKKTEADKLAAEAKAKEDALANELRKTLVLTVFEKSLLPENADAGRFQSFIMIKCVYENKSDKDIRAVKGAIRFADLFDKEILTSQMTIQDPVKAGQKANWIGQITYNQFISSHQQLVNTELKDMKVTWIPASIIFTDGTQIGEK